MEQSSSNQKVPVFGITMFLLFLAVPIIIMIALSNEIMWLVNVLMWVWMYQWVAGLLLLIKQS